MAKYTVTHSCGHTSTVQLVGPHKDREWRIGKLEQEICNDCRKAELERSNRAAADANKAAGLPALVGTPAQVLWAETVRKALLPVIQARAADFITRNAELAEQDRLEGPLPVGEYIFKGRTIRTAGGLRALSHGDERAAAVVAMITANTHASWWIDHRGGFSLAEFAEEAKKVVPESEAALAAERQRSETLAAEESKAAEAAAMAEAVLRPAKVATESVCEIRIAGEFIELHFAEKSERFREIVKFRHSFAWTGTCWKRKAGADKAVEMGVLILSLGIPVRIFDTAVRTRVASGEQIRENTKRIARVANGAYAGWFAITWKRHDGDYYAAAKRLKGARWDASQMVVPADQADEVAGFAETEGFALSPGAQETIATARAARERAVTVAVFAPSAPAPHERTAVPPALETPAAVDIADELRDNN